MLDRGSAQPSSPRASSSSGVHQPATPNYLSARSADVILSEVRPTRIKNEALRSVNILLDELLWLIVGCARSFSPDRLRTGLLKVLPTSLGKDALLEAEVELRAYIERNPPSTPLPTDEPTIQNFPLQPAFELLRLKCEAYSSLGDRQDDPESEETLHSRMIQIAGDTTPKPSAVAPAALYLTAILEYICEHVLSNVGRVVARDSSRTTAHAQDLYVALCEDETIYSLFKTMKVHEQIEQQTRPRRNPSISRNDVNTEMTPPAPSPPVPKPRKSVDSTTSNVSNTNPGNRLSSENKNRNKGTSEHFLKHGLNEDNGNVGENRTAHHRSNSLLGEKKVPLIPSDDGLKTEAAPGVSPADDDGTMQDFEDLMRSETTMKVSLTPDRLKTFEVFAREKNQRGNRPPYLSPSTSSRDTSSPPSSFPNGQLVHKSQSAKTRIPVESIAETPEEGPRPRASSITNSPISKGNKPPFNSRSRSLTDARITPTTIDAFSHSTEKYSSNLEPALPSQATMAAAIVDPAAGLPKRTRRPPARNLENIDLDDLMNVSDDDAPIVKKTSLTPKSAQATTSGARDLMDFLSEGPPEPPTVPPHSPSPTVTEAQRAKQGRFRTIVSRLTGGTSNERLTSRSGDDAVDSLHRSSTLGTGGTSTPLRPSPSLHSKRSTPNVAVGVRPPPMSSPSPPPHTQDKPWSSPGLRPRQPSMVRKAVPALDSSISTKPPAKPSESADPPRPLPKSPPVQLQSTEGVGASPANRKRPQHDQLQEATNGVNEPVVSSNSANGQPSINRHPKTEPDIIKPASRGSSKADHRVATQGLTLSIPGEEHIGDLRRMMARATSVEECRLLLDIFLARCGALPGEEAHGPMTPISPIRADPETGRHESNVVETLLTDSLAPPMYPSALFSDATSVSLGRDLPKLLGPTERPSSQPRSSPILTSVPSPSPIVA